MNNARDLLESVGVVPVDQILAVVVPHAVEIPKPTVSQFLHCGISRIRYTVYVYDMPYIVWCRPYGGIERGNKLNAIFGVNGVLHKSFY